MKSLSQLTPATYRCDMCGQDDPIVRVVKVPRRLYDAPPHEFAFCRSCIETTLEAVAEEQILAGGGEL